MAKKKEKVRAFTFSREYKGYVDEMPEEIKAIIEARIKKK